MPRRPRCRAGVVPPAVRQPVGRGLVHRRVHHRPGRSPGHWRRRRSTRAAIGAYGLGRITQGCPSPGPLTRPLEQLVHRRRRRLRDQMGEEVLLERHSGGSRPLPKRRVHVVRHVLHLDARHEVQRTAILAPLALLWRRRQAASSAAPKAELKRSHLRNLDPPEALQAPGQLQRLGRRSRQPKADLLVHQQLLRLEPHEDEPAAAAATITAAPSQSRRRPILRTAARSFRR